MLKRILSMSIIGAPFALAGCLGAPESDDTVSDIGAPGLKPEGDHETSNGYSSSDFGISVYTTQSMAAVAFSEYGFAHSAYTKLILSQPVGSRVIPELARCILPAGVQFTAADSAGNSHQIKGELGLAPEWAERPARADNPWDAWLEDGYPMSEANKTTRLERVSACVLALVNGHGKHVPISLSADFIGGAPDPAARSLYTVNEISVFGNIFQYTGDAQPISYYVCAEDPMVLACDQDNGSDWLKDRICGSQECNILRLGNCSEVCAGSAPGHRVCTVPYDGRTYSNVITVRLPRTSFGALNPSCDASALDDMDSRCDDGSVEDDSGWPSFIVGCAGKERFADRAALCGLGYQPAAATQWAAAASYQRYYQQNWGWPLTPPSYHYWTDDALDYDYPVSGSAGPGDCSVSAPGFPPYGSNGYSCGADPMRVCKPPSSSSQWGTTDPLGNVCNWSGCGLDSQGTNDYFGGCGNPTAGTLCTATLCGSDADCGAGNGLVCQWGTCRRGCNADAQCPAGSLCVPSPLGVMGNACEIVACEQDAQCPGAGHVCNTDKGLCQKGCHSNADCGQLGCYINPGESVGHCD